MGHIIAFSLYNILIFSVCTYGCFWLLCDVLLFIKFFILSTTAQWLFANQGLGKWGTRS